MKTILHVAKALLASFMLFCLHFTVMAQDNAITEQEVGNWFERYWMWIAGAILVLIIIIIASSSGRRRSKTTTVVRDEFGDVKSVSTTEIKD